VGLQVHFLTPQRALVWAGTLVVVVVAATTWGMVVRTLRSVQPVAPVTKPHSVVWGDRVFGSPAELGGWLRFRGASYALWRARHPGARAVLEPGAPKVALHRTKSRRSQAAHKQASTRAPARVEHKRASAGHSAARRAVSSPVQSRGPLRLLMLVSILLSGLCALGASVPWALGSRNPRLVQIVEPYRQLLFGTAAALLMGLVVGVALG
jgi:hypothetical protein